MFRPLRFPRRLGFAASLSLLGITGCLYGFAGGGLPANIKTVAVLPFDNLTANATLTQQVLASVRLAMSQRLGLREAGESQADAIVRGSITRYEPDIPVAYTGQADSAVIVTQRLLQITVSVEILDQKAGKPLWQRNGLTVDGNYAPGQEADGIRKALDKLVTNIVDGAQSQW